MKNKHNTVLTIAFTVVCFLFWYASANAQGGPNYCHDEDPGKFTFHVEQAITVDCEGDVDLGAICPGCTLEWTCGDPTQAPHMEFNGSGSLECPFEVTYTAWNNTGQHVKLFLFWYYWTGTTWSSFNSFGTPMYFMDVNSDGTGDYKWGAFICWFGADCEAVAGQDYRELTVKVDYVCLWH